MFHTSSNFDATWGKLDAVTVGRMDDGKGYHSCRNIRLGHWILIKHYSNANGEARNSKARVVRPQKGCFDGFKDNGQLSQTIVAGLLQELRLGPNQGVVD